MRHAGYVTHIGKMGNENMTSARKPEMGKTQSLAGCRQEH